MEIIVDDNKLDANFAGDGTVEDALWHVQSNLCPPGRMVIGLRCDGEDVPANAMQDTLSKHVSQFERLEVFTDTKSTLVAEAMVQAAASLEATEERCRRVAELLTEGKTTEAIEGLSKCVGTWQQINEAVSKSVQMLELDVENTRINDRPMIEFIKGPAAALLQIKDALQAQDHVLLADVLQYEFAEATDQWQEVLSRLQAEAEAFRASAS